MCTHFFSFFIVFICVFQCRRRCSPKTCNRRWRRHQQQRQRRCRQIFNTQHNFSLTKLYKNGFWHEWQKKRTPTATEEYGAKKGRNLKHFSCLKSIRMSFWLFFFLVTSDVKYSTCTDSSMGTHRFILFLNRYTHHTVSHIQIMVWDEADGVGMEAHTMSFGLFTFTAIISLNARLAQRGRRRFCAMWNDVYSIAAKMICAINNVDKYNILYTTSWVDDF